MKNNINVNTKKVSIYTEEQRSFKSRITNVGTLISLASVAIILLMQFGVIDAKMGESIKTVVYLICSAGVLLGILNNPVGDGIYLPGVDYPIFGKAPTQADIREVVGNKIIDSAIEINGLNIAKESEEIKNKLENR